MTDKIITPKKNVSADWLVRGVLTKFGDIFDRLTAENGRLRVV